ncbi:MAG: signal peptidase I [Bacteroidota bacterium]
MAKPQEKPKIQKDLKSARKRKPEPKNFQETVWSWTKTIVGAIIVVTILNGLAIASFVVPTGSMEKTVMTGDFLFVNKFIYGPSTPQVIPFVNIPLPFYRFPGIKDPQRGDVIVFIFPGNRDEIEPAEFQYYLKRCVAIGGDTLIVKDKKLIVNGKEVPMATNAMYDETMPVTPADKWQTFPYGRGFTRDNYGPIRIPKKGDVIQLTPENLAEWTVFISREGHTATSNGTQVVIDGKQTNTYTVARDYCFGMGDNRDHSLDSRYWGFVPVENVVGTPMIVYWSWDTGAPLFQLVDKIKSVRWSRIFTIIR